MAAATFSDATRTVATSALRRHERRTLTRVIRLASFALGAGLLAYLIVRSGPALLWHTVQHSAWVVLPIVLMWGVVYACSARAWQLLVPGRPAEFTFGKAFLLTITSFAMNFTTPGLSLGGEPLKIAGATPLLGRRRAVASVVSFRLLHATAHMLVLFVATIPAAILLPHTHTVVALLIVVAAISGGATTVLLLTHRDGIFERGVALVGRFPLLRRVARRLERHRGSLQELDREMSAAHAAPGQFRMALATETVGRIISTLEVAVIMQGLGTGFNVPKAFVASNLASMMTSMLFFMPMELGAKEGGLYLVFPWLGLAAALGTSAALLSRIREVIWAGIGIAALLVFRPAKGAGQR